MLPTAIDKLSTLHLGQNDLLDAEQIALGTYKPVAGFMSRETLMSVLEHCRLPTGEPWTMPILLPVSAEKTRGFAAGERVVLRTATGAAHSILEIEEIYQMDFATILKPWFGTESREHPGIARVLSMGANFVAGRITLVNRLPVELPQYDWTPAQLHNLFAAKGWHKIVAFHGRNLVHRGHEHIQMTALERVGADGLYVNPVIGQRKRGDFLPRVILRGYQTMIDCGLYPANKVVLGSFMTYPRYCGPREAVFTALCRRNMGCTHFIIGRDHTGVGGFYGANDGRRLFERLGDVGIEPVFFDAVGYDTSTHRYVNEDANPSVRSISGTLIRDSFVHHTPVPEWMMRPEIQSVVRAEIAAGRPVFQD